MGKNWKNGLFLSGLTLGLMAISCQRAAKSGADDVSAQPKSTVQAIAEAEALYAGRTDLAKARQATLELRQAMAANPDNYDVAWRLAKFDYYLGSHTTDESERDRAFQDGITAGQQAVKLQNNKPEGHFWLGANYGGSAENSTLAGLTETDRITQEMETVIKLDPGYQGGSAYMVLGQVYLESPRLLGGDRQKAVDFLEKGLRFGAQNSLLHLRLAEAYLALDRKQDARKQIDDVLTMKADPDYLPEYHDAVTQAQKLQEKLK